jgi:hypothetical protein
LPMPEPFWIEVGRMAHEPSEHRGVSAVLVAEQEEQSALASGKPDEHAFREAVAAALRPR